MPQLHLFNFLFLLFISVPNVTPHFIPVLNLADISKRVPPLQLATTTEKIENIQQYWVSEKLDGMRAYWDGHALYSRQGNLLHTPNWFTSHWPNVPMDGELWSQRGQFEYIMSCIRRLTIKESCWRNIAFHIFDLPKNNGTFTDRVAHIKTLTSATENIHLRAVEQFSVTNNTALHALLDYIVALGGEGLMLHRKDAHYHVGRSSNILKLKKYQDDEAVVLAHIAGQGKYKNMLGSILVRTSDDIEFKIGTGFTDKQRLTPPPIGALITYKYIGKTARGVPRFASFLRIRR